MAMRLAVITAAALLFVGTAAASTQPWNPGNSEAAFDAGLLRGHGVDDLIWAPTKVPTGFIFEGGTGTADKPASFQLKFVPKGSNLSKLPALIPLTLTYKVAFASTGLPACGAGARQHTVTAGKTIYSTPGEAWTCFAGKKSGKVVRIDLTLGAGLVGHIADADIAALIASSIPG